MVLCCPRSRICHRCAVANVVVVAIFVLNAVAYGVFIVVLVVMCQLCRFVVVFCRISTVVMVVVVNVKLLQMSCLLYTSDAADE